jgi:hypothetical protein
MCAAASIDGQLYLRQRYMSAVGMWRPIVWVVEGEASGDLT